MRMLPGVLALVALLAVPSVGFPQTDQLRGISEVGLFIAMDEKLAGIVDEPVLRTTAELRLRQSGLRLVPPESPTAPTLIQEINGMIRTDGLVVYTVSLELMEAATVHRTRTVRELITWKVAMTGSVGRPGAAASLRQAVTDQVDEFLNAWLAANPITR